MRNVNSMEADQRREGCTRRRQKKAQTEVGWGSGVSYDYVAQDLITVVAYNSGLETR